MNSTITCIGRRKVVAQYVKELLRLSSIGYPSITITAPEKSEACSARIVIDTSLVDIVETTARTYSKLRTSTSHNTTLDGSSHQSLKENTSERNDDAKVE